jgi:hypothetical protein
MTTQNSIKLKTLINVLKPGVIVTGPFLESIGISRNLQKYYLKAGWLEPVGRGAYKRPGDKVEWAGGLNAIQKQIKTKIHVGGLSALSLHGLGHYIRFDRQTLYLFSQQKTKLPKWFAEYDWRIKVFHKSTSFLSADIGLKTIKIDQIPVIVSSPERAILEVLYLSPQFFDLEECYHLFEGLVNLQPILVRKLLLDCNSVKVKRLFLYMAEKANHQWLQFIQIDDINLGKGNRMITKNGVYSSKYLISIPKELSEL